MESASQPFRTCGALVCCWGWNIVSKIDTCAYLSVCVYVCFFVCVCAYTKAHGRHDAVVMHWRLMGFEQELVLTVYCSRPPRRELLNSRESLLAVATMEAGQTKRLNVPTRTHQTKRVNSYTTTRPGGSAIFSAVLSLRPDFIRIRTRNQKSEIGLNVIEIKTSVLRALSHTHVLNKPVC